MKRTRPAASSFLAMFAAVISSACAQSQSPSASAARIDRDYGRIPLGFEANRGQADRQVRFLARGAGYCLFLTDEEAILELHRHGKPDQAASPQIIRMQLVDSSFVGHFEGVHKLPGVVNYFESPDPARWHSAVPTYSRVKRPQIYPGIDLVYYGNQRRLEYDFVVAAHADPSRIAFRFAGAGQLRLDPGGDLEISAHGGAISLRRPTIYQISAGRRLPVKGRFTLRADNTVAFELAAFDRSKPLIIDPVLVYGTYLGGTSGDGGVAIAVDAQGSAYVTGVANSDNFPVTKGAFMTKRPEPYVSRSAVFVAKINPKGTGLVYSTFLGGSGGESPAAIAVNAQGEAYVTGNTYSSNFPVTKGAYDTAFPLSGVSTFLTKFNATGSALLFSTFFPDASVNGLALDAASNAYITGLATWQLPTTPGAFETSLQQGLDSAYVAKINPTGTKLIYSTFIGQVSVPPGGETQSDGTSIVVDKSGNAYVAGLTYDGFPVTKGAFQTEYNAKGAEISFIAKLNAQGSDLDYATYLGDAVYLNDTDGKVHIAIDKQGDACFAASTAAADFPVTKGAFQRKPAGASNNPNAYIAKLNAAGSALLAGTYLGGGATTYPAAVRCDTAGNILVAGTNHAATFPVTSNALVPKGGGDWSGFLTRFNPAATALTYSTFYSGNFDTYMGGMAIDASNNIYLTGETFATAFPVTKGAIQTVNHDYPDGFVGKVAFVPGASATKTAVTSDANPARSGAKIVFTAYVSAAEDAGPLTGKVKFSIDGGAPVSVTLDDTGHAQLSVATLKQGSHSVKAGYLGSLDYDASSGSLKEIITAP